MRASTRQIILVCVIGFLLALSFLFLFQVFHIQEGLTTPDNVLQIIDADLCYGSKCLSSDAQEKALKTLNATVYDNNLDITSVNLKSLGLSESDISFNPTNLEDSVFSIQYRYGSGSYDLSFNYGKPLNLANWNKGELKIQSATYCYTDTSGNAGLSSVGQQYCIPESDNLLNNLQGMIVNNTLSISKLSPATLGNVSNPYSLVPNSKKITQTSDSQLEITYSFGANPAKSITAWDGDSFNIT